MARKIKKVNKPKKRKLKITAILIIILSLLLGLMIGILLNIQFKVTTEENETAGTGELPAGFLSTDGFEKVVSVNVEPPTLMLSTECARLEMNITDDQIYSIAYALRNLTPARPLTHDLIKNILDNYQIEILQIKIDSVTSEDIYRAKIILQEGNKVLALDSRPSDATAISLRTEKDMWIKKDILDKYAVKTC